MIDMTRIRKIARNYKGWSPLSNRPFASWPPVGQVAATLGLHALAQCAARPRGARLSRGARPRRARRAGPWRLCRCDLVCDGSAPLDGAAETIELTLEGARKLHERAFDAAKGEGFTLDATPLRLTPWEKLARIVRASRDKSLSDEGGDAANE
jgi:hypothetical protein